MSRRRLSAGVAADLAAAREQNASEGVPRPDRPKLRGSTAPSPMRPRQGVVLSKQAREPTVSPKRRRVDSPNRRILTRAHTGPVFQKEQFRQPLARVNTVAGGRVSVAQPSLRHGIKDISIKNVTQAPLKPIEEQENVPPDGNRLSVGSLDSVCLSDGQEVVDLGDGAVRDSFLSQEEQFYEDYQDSPSPILQQQQMSPEAFSYRPHSQQGVYQDRGSSARSMAPTVDLANSEPEPSAWEYSFAAPGDQSVAATIYSPRTSVAGDDELAQTQWQASQRLPSSQVPPAGQHHTSPEFGFRPYGKTGPVQNYRPSAQGHATGAGCSAVSWETRPISGDSVSYAPFNGQTQAQSEVGEPDRGIHELEGYRSDTSQRAQPRQQQQQQKPFTLTQVQMGGDTPRSEASCSSYYANLLDAAATQAAQQQARPEATTVPSHAALERATAPLASLASQAYQQRPLDTGQASYVMGAGSGPSGWGPPQIGPGTGEELHTMATDRIPGRDRLADIPLSKEIVGTAEIAEKLGEIIGKHLPGDAYDYHIYVEAFNK
ncbi:hypothetical protein Pmar_PMAR020251 [Perkinsus marinus ATCC 50983]|uniref:Uncharacterized protein n=1 Tax=Perkinsus marinus (strain ATCC 50983 / TXsc) TaxID=423536 RepID=C5LTZ5_PERM5|nr:hypothetical protein Pmar_PMAR020251 [Perkinsus marinus ATCC 50983]EEQ99793.1 hypothetical protein Pmar_PMAR020251 [Perkinsus marinus ATCC 50983]|eukprot:XP_002767076.1 hypothetical protein Pmar_PMAR020251 [Perkinsus marinus ATCC 50983]